MYNPLAAEFYILDNSRMLTPAQEFLRRLTSRHSKNKFILAMHGTGWGKTKVFADIAIDYLLADIKVVVINKGSTGRVTFENEVDKATKMGGIDTKSMKGHVNYHNYLEFASYIDKTSDKIIHDTFNGCLFILDEVHNVKSEESDCDESDMKASLKPLLTIPRICPDSRFLCASATPLINSEFEINYLASLYSLVNHGTGIPDDTDLITCADMLSGSISYSEDSDIDISIDYVGSDYNGTNVVPLKMSDYQWYIYSLDNYIESGPMKMKDRLNSLMVLPTGQSVSNIYTIEDDNIRLTQYGTDLLSSTDISQCSAKYSYALNIINTTLGHIFLYCEIVNDTGINMLRAILQANGFDEYRGGPMASMQRALRYTYITGNDSQTSKKEKISVYNSSENTDGSYIKVIIGSKVVGEAVSLMNTCTVVLLTMSWNVSTERQIIGRVIRRGSHDALPPQMRKVSVHRLVAIRDTNLYSINNSTCVDLRMVDIMADKRNRMAPIIDRLREGAAERSLRKDVDCNILDYVNYFKYYVQELVSINVNNVWKHMLCKGLCNISDLVYIYKGNLKVTIECILRMIHCNMGISYFGGKSLYLRRYGDIIYVTEYVAVPFNYRPNTSMLFLRYKESIQCCREYNETTDDVPSPFEMSTMSDINIIRMCRAGGTYYYRKFLRTAILNSVGNVIELFKFCLSSINNTLYTTMYAKSSISTEYTNQYIDIFDHNLIVKFVDGNMLTASKDEAEIVALDLRARLDRYKSGRELYYFVSTSDFKFRIAFCGDEKLAFDKRKIDRGTVASGMNVSILRDVFCKYIVGLNGATDYVSSLSSYNKDQLAELIERFAFNNNLAIAY